VTEIQLDVQTEIDALMLQLTDSIAIRIQAVKIHIHLHKYLVQNVTIQSAENL